MGVSQKERDTPVLFSIRFIPVSAPCFVCEMNNLSGRPRLGRPGNADCVCSPDSWHRLGLMTAARVPAAADAGRSLDRVSVMGSESLAGARPSSLAGPWNTTWTSCETPCPHSITPPLSCICVMTEVPECKVVPWGVVPVFRRRKHWNTRLFCVTRETPERKVIPSGLALVSRRRNHWNSRLFCVKRKVPEYQVAPSGLGPVSRRRNH